MEQEIICQKCAEKSKTNVYIPFVSLNTRIQDYPKSLINAWTAPFVSPISVLGFSVAKCPKCGYKNTLPIRNKRPHYALLYIAVVLILISLFSLYLGDEGSVWGVLGGLLFIIPVIFILSKDSKLRRKKQTV